jgi:hypothetical protein
VARSVPLEERSGVGATCLGQGSSGVVRLLLYIMYRSPLYSPFSACCVCPGGRSRSRVRIRGGVAAFEVDWASEEAPALAEPSLNLVLHIHLRIFVYTSNTLMVSFE